MASFLSVETRASPPLETGGRRLTLFSRALTVRIPGAPAALIWNRPVSVLSVSADGQEEIIPVPDITRQVLWGLAGLSAAVLFLTRRMR